MITQKPAVFFANGHKCRIEYESREHYKGYVGDEEIIESHNTSNIRDELIFDAKYREEVEPNYGEVCEAVWDFLGRQKHRKTDRFLWVYGKTVSEYVTPTESWSGIAYRALLDLEDTGLVENGKICMELNAEDMWRRRPGRNL